MSIPLLLAEAARRGNSTRWRDTLDRRHKKQARFVQDPSRYLAAMCTRRAGKSNGLAYRFFRAAQKHPGSLCPYITLTRRSAYNIMWPIFKQVAHDRGIAATFTKSDLTITLEENGSQIQLFGADTENFINRLRGPKYPFAAVDEAQSFKEHINELLDDVLTPAIGDYEDGAVAITGTPGPVAAGLFYDITRGRVEQMGFSVHEWSWADNPYLKNYQAFVDDLRRRRGWDENHPTYRREWLGQWVQDLDAMVYKFLWERNVTQVLPLSETWHYVLGVDLGYDPDPSAFVLCAYSPYHPKLYVIDTYKQTKMIVSDVAERIKYYLKSYPYAKIVIDAGGQGKQIAEEMRQRYQIPLHAAEKQGKSGFIELMNSDFARGNIQLLQSCALPLANEYRDLIWDATKKDRKEDPRFPNHLSDAALYAWRYCYNYAWQNKPVKTNPHSEQAIDEFFEREARKIEQAQRDRQEDMSEWGF